MINKLVRDKIPEIIAANNQIARIRIADDKEYITKLDEKLQEETSKYLDSGNVEELADLLEVIYAILSSKNVDIKSFEQIREEKAKKNGLYLLYLGFDRVELCRGVDSLLFSLFTGLPSSSNTMERSILP